MNKDKVYIRSIFDSFVDDPTQDVITLSALRRMASTLGDQISDDKLKAMLEQASSNGTELTFEEFYGIMTRN